MCPSGRESSSLSRGTKLKLWAVSSTGRATRLHRVGCRFESYTAHHYWFIGENDYSEIAILTRTGEGVGKREFPAEENYKNRGFL